jgi:hypothetical protein
VLTLISFTVLSVILTALKILQSISYSAEEEYTNLLSHCDDTSQRPKDIGASPTPIPQELGTPSPSASASRSVFHEKTVKELEELIQADSTLVETTVARHEHGLHLAHMSSNISDDLQMADPSLRAQPYF